MLFNKNEGGEEIMQFKDYELNSVLEAIEENMSFVGDNIANPTDWNLNVKVSIQELIDKEPEKANTVRYIVKVLDSLGYISFSQCDYSTITGVTASGLKLIMSKLHQIEFNN